MATLEMLKTLSSPSLPRSKTVSSITYSIGNEDFSVDEDINDQIINASRKGDLPLIQWLLETGANINAKCKNTGTTPLLAAARNGYGSVVEVLCKTKSVDINTRDVQKKSALYYAIVGESSQMVKCLCEVSADVQEEVCPGRRVLELAITCGGNPDIVRTLIDYGASTGKNPKTKKTPLDVAKVFNCSKLLDIPKPRKRNKIRNKTGQDLKERLKQTRTSSDKEQDQTKKGYDVLPTENPENSDGYTELSGENIYGNIIYSATNNLPVIDNTDRENPYSHDNETPKEIADSVEDRSASSTDSSEIYDDSVYWNIQAMNKVNDYEQINDDIYSNECRQSEARESSLYYEVPEMKNGAVACRDDETDDGDYANIVDEKMQRGKKVPPAVPPKPSSKSPPVEQSDTVVYESAQISTQKPQLRKNGSSKKGDRGRQQEPDIRETTKAKATSEGSVMYRELQGRRDIKGRIPKLPPDAVCYYVENMHFACPVQYVNAKEVGNMALGGSSINVKLTDSYTSGSDESSD